MIEQGMITASNHQLNNIAPSPGSMELNGMRLLLDRLGEDDALGGRKYRDLTVTLFLFCEQRMRRPTDADDIVRRTIDIVVSKLAEGDNILNLQAYSFAVARHLLSDYRKRVLPEGLDDTLQYKLKCNRKMVQIESMEKEIRDECRQKCLQGLAADQRDLILKYYEHGLHCKKYREDMASAAGISIEALTNRISRIRKKLCQCCGGCKDRLKTGKLYTIALYA